MSPEYYYRIVIRYFLLLLILLLLTGLWMFWLHTSFQIEISTLYYAKKSFFGLLETVNPHLFGMGVVFFILTHFFAVIQKQASSKIYYLSLTLFTLMILSNLSGFFIPFSEVFSIIKLCSTLAMVLVSLYLSYKLFKL